MPITLLFIAFLISEIALAQYNLWHGMVSGGGCKQIRNSCQDLYNAGCKTTGQFQVKINSVTTTVRCEQEIGGGGWMVFQMREALFDFYRDWGLL